MSVARSRATDKLDGGDGTDTVSGDAGNDNLVGGEGDDKAYGGTGDDDIDAGAGNDTVFGDSSNTPGADTIVGGDGDDKLYGGSVPRALEQTPDQRSKLLVRQSRKLPTRKNLGGTEIGDRALAQTTFDLFLRQKGARVYGGLRGLELRRARP
jgi:hypothetical protein